MSKAKIAEVGNITVAEGMPEGDDQYQYELAMIVQFDTREALHEALTTGQIECEPWS